MSRATVVAILAALAFPGAALADITYPDLSNNDPVYNMRAVARHGHRAVVLKTNQGIGFIDRTFVPMAKAAKAAGLAVGGYDFDQEYTAAEAYVFIARLHAAGIYRNTPNTLAPTLDVEFGVPSWPGLEHQIAVLLREFGRVSIYTGQWYWAPHFGCRVPSGVSFWLSGYPRASLLCGLPGSRWVSHQFTDHGFNGVLSGDMSRWRGSGAGWQSFAALRKPGPTAAQLRASLGLHRGQRASFHRLIERHHCRKGQHVIPRVPLKTRRHLHNELCPRWTGLGNREIRVIQRLEAQLKTA